MTAAIEEIERGDGYASLSDIARAGGVTKPILYQHFGDRSGLVAALAEHFLLQLVPSALRAFSRESEPKEMVRGAIRTFVDFVEKNRALYRFLVRDTYTSFIEQPLFEDLAQRFAQVLATGLQNPPAARAEIWAFSTIGTVFTGAEWWVVSGSISRGELIDELTELVWRGIAGGGVRKLTAEAILLSPLREPAP